MENFISGFRCVNIEFRNFIFTCSHGLIVMCPRDGTFKVELLLSPVHISYIKNFAVYVREADCCSRLLLLLLLQAAGSSFHNRQVESCVKLISTFTPIDHANDVNGCTRFVVSMTFEHFVIQGINSGEINSIVCF